jgi:transposase
LEEQSQRGRIDLYYGDESQVSEVGYVPYGWQFADEQVAVAASKGRSKNYFGLLSRSNEFFYKATETTITSAFVLEQLDAFSLKLVKATVIVLDNARIHTAKKIKERLSVWQRRGLYLFYLPPYSPHMNIIERLWKELKGRWLRPSDYGSAACLFYATELALAAVGKTLRINFSSFKL